QVFDVGDVDDLSARGKHRDVVRAVARNADVVVAARAAGGDAVVARDAVDDKVIADALVVDEDLSAAQRVDDRRAGLHIESDRVVAGREGYRHHIGGAVVAAVKGAEVDVDLGHVGAGEVVHDDVVGAAEGPDVDAL